MELNAASLEITNVDLSRELLDDGLHLSEDGFNDGEVCDYDVRERGGAWWRRRPDRRLSRHVEMHVRSYVLTMAYDVSLDNNSTRKYTLKTTTTLNCYQRLQVCWRSKERDGGFRRGLHSPHVDGILFETSPTTSRQSMVHRLRGINIACF